MKNLEKGGEGKRREEKGREGKRREEKGRERKRREEKGVGKEKAEEEERRLTQPRIKSKLLQLPPKQRFT